VLEPRKNHIILFEALRYLRERGESVDLVVIGREGWHWTSPLTRPEFQSLTPWVKIIADVPDADLVEFYNRAAVFAYPSWYEGFGLPVLEAMACGTPVVCSSASALPEAGGDAALYADPHDSAAFAAQLSQVLADGALRRRMVDAGIRWARQFSWRRTAEETIAVYQSVCGAPTASAPVASLESS